MVIDGPDKGRVAPPLRQAILGVVLLLFLRHLPMPTSPPKPLANSSIEEGIGTGLNSTM